MEPKYPIKFTLENGTHVVVNNTGSDTYDFSLTTDKSGTRHFSYTDDERPKEEKEAALDFEQMDALRTFWLEKEEAE